MEFRRRARDLPAPPLPSRDHLTDASELLKLGISKKKLDLVRDGGTAIKDSE